jgi:PAS domain S-box-containing protein
MLGYEPEEFPMSAEAWLELLHPEDKERAFRVNNDCIENRASCFEVEFRLRTKGGQWKWILGRGKAVARDADGKAVRMVGTHVDIDDRKRSEQRLRESESMYRQLFELESDAIFLIAKTGDILEANRTASALYGYTKEELVSMKNLDLSAEPEETLHATVSGVRLIPVRLHRKKDGTVFPVEITATHFSWKGREVHLAAIRDITERNRAEEERKALVNQLSQSQKMEAVGQLAGGIAHDFNNILTVILGYSHIVLEKLEQNSPIRPPIGEILSSAAKARELTKGLLAFSRKQMLHPAIIDLGTLVEDTKKMLERLVREDIDMTTRLPETILAVNADKGQIVQVLMNLVTNAVDAMPDGGTLTIEVDQAVIDKAFVVSAGFGKEGIYAGISVSDTGSGFDEETKKKIFEPFFTTKETGQGTGLGLSIVYGIVKQHEGFINVESEPGRGTTFRIFLPLVEQGLESFTEEQPEQGRVTEGTETILLAEDDAGVREMNRITYSQAGYRVITAADGEEAVLLYARNQGKVDLLVFDVIMPRKHGRQAYEQIKAMAPKIKVLFISGYTKDIISLKGVSDDEVFFIPKPFKPGDLLRKTREILDR